MPAPKPDRDPVAHFNKAARNAMIEGNHRAVKIVAALEAGRDAKKEIADFKAVMNAKRLDDILQAHDQEAEYKGILSKVLQTVADMKASLPDAFVRAVRELATPCNFKIALTPVPTQKGNGKSANHLHSKTKGTPPTPLQIAPVPQKSPEYVPLQPGQKYTVHAIEHAEDCRRTVECPDCGAELEFMVEHDCSVRECRRCGESLYWGTEHTCEP
jgi:hypothetical protein